MFDGFAPPYTLKQRAGFILGLTTVRLFGAFNAHILCHDEKPGAL